jgi:hypothetical protein
MTPWIAKRLKAASHQLELEDDYSGRGMMGSETSAVVGPLGAFAFAVAQVALGLENESEQGEFNVALLSLRTDSMGRETVFY